MVSGKKQFPVLDHFIPARTIQPSMVTSCFQPAGVTGDRREPSKLQGTVTEARWQVTTTPSLVHRVPPPSTAPRCTGQHPQLQDKTAITHHARLIATIRSAEVKSDWGPVLWSLLIGEQCDSSMSGCICGNGNFTRIVSVACDEKTRNNNLDKNNSRGRYLDDPE